jgi:hypothetical protein
MKNRKVKPVLLRGGNWCEGGGQKEKEDEYGESILYSCMKLF